MLVTETEESPTRRRGAKDRERSEREEESA